MRVIIDKVLVHTESNTIESKCVEDSAVFSVDFKTDVLGCELRHVLTIGVANNKKYKYVFQSQEQYSIASTAFNDITFKFDVEDTRVNLSDTVIKISEFWHQTKSNNYDIFVGWNIDFVQSN
jgi:hypothetical protein